MLFVLVFFACSSRDTLRHKATSVRHTKKIGPIKRDDNSLAIDFEEKAGFMNSYFTTIGEKLANQLATTDTRDYIVSPTHTYLRFQPSVYQRREASLCESSIFNLAKYTEFRPQYLSVGSSKSDENCSKRKLVSSRLWQLWSAEYILSSNQSLFEAKTTLPFPFPWHDYIYNSSAVFPIFFSSETFLAWRHIGSKDSACSCSKPLQNTSDNRGLKCLNVLAMCVVEKYHLFVCYKSLAVAYLRHIYSILKRRHIRRIITQCFETPAFKHTWRSRSRSSDCLMFPFGAKNAVLGPGLRGLVAVRDLTDVRCF